MNQGRGKANTSQDVGRPSHAEPTSLVRGFDFVCCVVGNLLEGGKHGESQSFEWLMICVVAGAEAGSPPAGLRVQSR